MSGHEGVKDNKNADKIEQMKVPTYPTTAPKNISKGGHKKLGRIYQGMHWQNAQENEQTKTIISLTPKQ